MAPYRLQAQFGGLNTELFPHALQSGTADEALNVVIDGTTLKGRAGFDEVSEAEVADGEWVLNLATVGFDDGTFYQVSKQTDGILYEREVYPATEDGWNAITDVFDGHDGSDVGAFFAHADRLLYCDREGGTKWHHDDGTWKAGVDCVNTPTVTAAANGEKEGWYHVAATKRNSVTREESQIGGFEAEAVETRNSDGTGGLAVSAASWISLWATDTDYEWDEVLFYCTQGDTERIGSVSVASFVAFIDVISEQADGSAGLRRADWALPVRDGLFTNAGGPPPGARFVAYNGSRAVYADCWDVTWDSGDGEWVSEAIPNTVMFSLPRFPTMVPQEREYSATSGVHSYAKTVIPKPWRGVLEGYVVGDVTGVQPIGLSNDFVLFTTASTYWLSQVDDGRLMPRLALTMGCASETGSAATSTGAYALSGTGWIQVTPDGLTNIARYRFTPTLEAIPAENRDRTVAGTYPYRDEVWMAVSKTSETAEYAVVYDGANYAWLEESHGLTDYTRPMQPFPDNANQANGDAVYFGATSTFTSIPVSLARAASYASYSTAKVTFKYWNGAAWSTLTVTDGTTTASSSGFPFEQDGTISFEAPEDWAIRNITVDGTVYSAYWVEMAIADDGGFDAPVLESPGPTKILIYDEAAERLVTTFEPVNLIGACITWMGEESLPESAPRMLVALSDGRLLAWPGETFTDAYSPDTETPTRSYACRWQGYYGQERRYRTQCCERAIAHCLTNSDGVQLTVTGLQGAQQDVTGTAYTLTSTSEIDIAGMQLFPQQHGNLFRVEFDSTAESGAEWEIGDLLLELSETE